MSKVAQLLKKQRAEERKKHFEESLRKAREYAASVGFKAGQQIIIKKPVEGSWVALEDEQNADGVVVLLINRLEYDMFTLNEINSDLLKTEDAKKKRTHAFSIFYSGDEFRHLYWTKSFEVFKTLMYTEKDSKTDTSVTYPICMDDVTLALFTADGSEFIVPPRPIHNPNEKNEPFFTMFIFSVTREVFEKHFSKQKEFIEKYNLNKAFAQMELEQIPDKQAHYAKIQKDMLTAYDEMQEQMKVMKPKVEEVD